MGSVYARSAHQSEYAQEIKRSVSEAIRKVKENPSHD
jgi:hypothetical protein